MDEYEKELLELSQKAKAGDANAMFSLGYYGCGSFEWERNAEGAYWYEEAAKLGSQRARFEIIRCYLEGRGVVPSLEKAKYWAEFEHPSLKKWIGKLNEIDEKYSEYNLRSLTAQEKRDDEYKEKRALYLEKHRQRLHERKAFIDSLSAKGVNVNALRDINWASNANWLKKDIEKREQEIAGIDFDGLHKRAESGCPEAQYELARDYRNGFHIQQDFVKAFELYKKAAAAGHAGAQNALGEIYETGYIGRTRGEGYVIKRKTKKQKEMYNGMAIELYKKAIEQGHVGAMANLGYCYVSGIGVEKSYETGVRWLLKAYDLGADVDLHGIWDMVCKIRAEEEE